VEERRRAGRMGAENVIGKASKGGGRGLIKIRVGDWQTMDLNAI
jgi:hypothetical protein